MRGGARRFTARFRLRAKLGFFAATATLAVLASTAYLSLRVFRGQLLGLLSESSSIWGHGGEIGPDLGRTRAGALTDSELAAAMWNHVPRMWGKMQEEKIPHVAIAEAEMRDLFAYLSFVRALDEPGDPEVGRILLAEKRCGTCHALDDRRGKVAPDLRRWARYRNPAVWAKLMFDHAPRMMQEMARRDITPPSLDARELVHVVSYIRSLAAAGEAELLDPGDAAVGERIFRERCCIGCHAIRGRGGRVGPDLGRRAWVTSFTGVAIAQWKHAAGMRAAMAVRGIEVPSRGQFTGASARCAGVDPWQAYLAAGAAPARPAEAAVLHAFPRASRLHPRWHGSGNRMANPAGARGRGIWAIVSLPDDIPIVLMLALVGYFTRLSFEQARRNDRLIREDRRDEVLRTMQ